MQFSNFSRSEEDLTITFYNEMPIENVGAIKYYQDNASGSYSKKEFRWSFNNEYWSAWEKLTQSGISSINTHNNYYFFLEVRYVKSALTSGTVTSFTVNYTKGTAINCIPCTPGDVESYTSDASSAPYTVYNIKNTYKIIPITDASLLNGYPGTYYLDRSHHSGYQPISSITNLQNILNQLISASGVTQLYVDGSLYSRDVSIAWLVDQHYLKESSIGTGFVWNNGYLDVSGGSGKDYDASIYYLTTYVEDLSTRISNLTIVVADLSTYVTTLDASNLKTVSNIGGGAGEIFKQISGRDVELRTIAPATSGVSVTVVGDQIRIGLDASISGESTWQDPDPISADVGGIHAGDKFDGSTAIGILDKMLYEYYPPVVNLYLEPSSGYYEKWNGLVPPSTIYGNFNNSDFVKVRVTDISAYVSIDGGSLVPINNPSTYTQLSYPNVSDGTFLFKDQSFPIWENVVYHIKFYNNVNGITMPTLDTSINLTFVEPYIYGLVDNTVTKDNITPAIIQNFHNVGKTRIVPKQSNEINFVRDASMFKIKFVYAYPYEYGNLTSIFDVKNDFNVTSSFEDTSLNIVIGASSPIPYKVYIKTHWIDVSTFKLIFNI